MDDINRSELFAALSLVQGELRPAVKDATGQIGQQKTKYADLASCWDACRAALTKHGLSVIQIPAAEGPKVTVTTILAHKSGQYISGELTMTASAGTPQPIGSAITYARRYALCSMVGIAPEDDDGSSASQVQQPAARKVAPVKPVTDRPKLNATEKLLEVTETLESMADKYSSLKVLGNLKSAMIKAFGTEQGERAYYGVLGKNGVEHANEFKSLAPAKKAARELMEMLESLDVPA